MLDGFYLLFEEYLQDKTSVYILKLCWEKDQSLEESPRSVTLVKNFNIIQFGFSMMLRIMQISEAVITFSLFCIILHNILSLIQ